MMDQDTLDSLSNAVSEDAWEHRKAFVGFGAADEAILRELRPVALQYADEVMDELYGRWLQFPELKRFFPEAATLSRVKALQRQYFVSLTGGEYDAAYLAHRLRVGAVHKKIGLTPEWVMGAFSIYLELILPRVLRAFEYDRVKQARAVTALTKLITLDEQLALAGYFAEAARQAPPAMLPPSENRSEGVKPVP
jgi:rsbT co-antagonist protein RsbR